MNSICRLAILFFCTAGAAHAVEPMKELGLPLGQKLSMPIALCPSEGPARDATAPCWVKPPRALKGGIQSGFLAVPAATGAKGWAAPGTYDVAVDRTGTLYAVTVHSGSADDFVRLRGMLTARLGKDLRRFSNDDQGRFARWEWRDAVVELDCRAEASCVTQFVLDDREERRLQAAMNVRDR